MVFSLLILFLGLVTPFSLPTLLTNALAFGLLAYAQVKKLSLKNKIMAWLSLSLGWVIIYSRQTEIFLVGLGFLVAWLAFWFPYFLKLKLQGLIRLVLVVLGLGFFVVVIVDGNQLGTRLAQQIPAPFMTDMDAYLNVVYEYKKTGDYYQVFAESLKGLQGNWGTQQLAGEIWGWKQPLIFTIWKMLPGNPSNIQWLGAIAFSFFLWAVYLVARNFLPAQKALLAPFIIWPYLHYPLTEMTVLQVEWWALVLFAFGLASYWRSRLFLAGVFFALSLAVRELFLIPMVGVIAIHWLKRGTKTILGLVLPTLFIFGPCYYFYHLSQVAKYESFSLLSAKTFRFGVLTGWEYVRTTLAYSSWGYAAWMVRPFLWLLILNSLGLLLLFCLAKKGWQYLSLLSSFLLFFILAFKLGIMDTSHDYWGIYYVPMLLLVTPVVFQGLDKLWRHLMKYFRFKDSSFIK